MVFSTWLQFNPKRIISTSANVDDKSIRERKCFLCLENLPDEQKGLLYRDEFLILCNPAPIFPRHFTISTVRHTRQEIGKFIGTLLSLAKELSPNFIVFYNGLDAVHPLPTTCIFRLARVGRFQLNEMPKMCKEGS